MQILPNIFSAIFFHIYLNSILLKHAASEFSFHCDLLHQQCRQYLPSINQSDRHRRSTKPREIIRDNVPYMIHAVINVPFDRRYFFSRDKLLPILWMALDDWNGEDYSLKQIKFGDIYQEPKLNTYTHSLDIKYSYTKRHHRSIRNRNKFTSSKSLKYFHPFDIKLDIHDSQCSTVIAPVNAMRATLAHNQLVSKVNQNRYIFPYDELVRSSKFTNFQSWYNDPELIHVFFGPMCDFALAPVIRYSSIDWSIPLLTIGGTASYFFNNSEVGLLTRVGPGQYNYMVDAIRSILNHFSWKASGIINIEDDVHGRNFVKKFSKNVTANLKDFYSFYETAKEDTETERKIDARDSRLIQETGDRGDCYRIISAIKKELKISSSSIAFRKRISPQPISVLRNILLSDLGIERSS
ncbi:hypothetical protein SNEBB_001319 [Seison nebaliae]|nr:hypothetical protein SNEBB_001319 [Seison nebaliae]